MKRATTTLTRTGHRKVEFATLLTFTSYNLVRMRNPLAPGFT